MPVFRPSLRPAALSLALGLALACTGTAAAQAALPETPAPEADTSATDTSAATPGLFDTRLATGHKPRRRGVRPAAVPPAASPAPEAAPAPPLAVPSRTYAGVPITPGGGTPIAAVPPPRPPLAAPQAQEASTRPPLYDAVPARPAFFDSRIAWGHKAPAERADPLFDFEIAEGHKVLPAAEMAGLFDIPTDALVLIEAQARIVRLRFGGTARRQQRYFPAIERALAIQELPNQLKYLALIESGLDAQAVSSAGARGIWQIMPETAGDFGLDSMAVHDPAKATPAALLYLDRLHRMFGEDWLMALAAYNAGPGRVFGAVRDFERIVGRKPTYWELRHRLPEETREYVPRFLATVQYFEGGA